MGKIVQIKPNGEYEVIDKDYIDFDSFAEYVGDCNSDNWPDTICFDKDLMMVVDDNNMYKRMSINEVASSLIDHTVRGNVVICYCDEYNEPAVLSDERAEEFIGAVFGNDYT